VLTINQIKHIKSLHQKKYRLEYREFIAEGPKIVDELINSRFDVKQVFGLEANKQKYLGLSGEGFTTVSGKDLSRISALTTPNEVLALIAIPRAPEISPGSLKGLTLILDDIQDPGNLGTIIRTADWFGVNNIICSEKTVDVYNPKVVQATMGSIARVNVYYTALGKFMDKVAEGIKIYGTLLKGNNIYTSKLNHDAYIVFGNESKGISSEISRRISEAISIPCFHTQGFTGAESLNVSVATAVVCAEFMRQKEYQ